MIKNVFVSTVYWTDNRRIQYYIVTNKIAKSLNFIFIDKKIRGYCFILQLIRIYLLKVIIKVK